MGRVISNTFSLTAVPDVQATRPNLVHCSQFNADRLGWWVLPSSSNAWSFAVESGMYGIDGYNAYGMLARPGMIADIKQYLAKEYRASQADYNNETSNYALDAGKWYTLSFKVRGIAKKQNSDGSFSDGGNTRLYVYLTGYNGGGVSIVDTSEKYIVDGVEKSPSGDMNTSFILGWTVSTHTITFKTRSDLKTISNHAVPVLYFRSFGEGHTTYPTYFANGGCLFRVAAIKIEEGMEATAYTPHATEMQPPVHAVAFKRDNTDISGTAPTGGTYTSPTPTGWSDGIPTGEARLWETKAVFVPELPSATWSKPSPVGDTSDSDVEFSPYDGTPVSDVSSNLAAAGTAATPTTNKWFDPVRNAGADFTKMIWRAERQKKNGVWDSSWGIVKVKGETGEKGEAGKDAVTLDLDNQMDSIAVDSDGNVTIVQTVTTRATIFKGATPVTTNPSSVSAEAINGVSAIVSSTGGVVTLTWKFPVTDGVTYKAFEDKHYTSDITIVSGGVAYKATFTLSPVRGGADGKNAVIYNVHPSLTSCPFSRTSSNGYSPTSYSLTCGYVCNNGGISTTVANATGSFNGGWHIFYRINSSGTLGDWNLYEKAVSVIYYNRSIEFCIAKTSVAQELNDDPYDSLIVDRETVPVVVGGSNGSNGTSAYTVDLDNEMDAIPCYYDGRAESDKSYSLNIGAYLGTSSLTITGCTATVSPAHSGITVDTTTKNAPVVNVSSSSSYRYSESYAITFEVTTSQGTRNVVFTLATQRAGSDGESPIVYQLVPSHTSLSFSRNADGTLSGSYQVSCQVSQTIGSGTAIGNAGDFGLNVKYGTSDSNLKTYTGALTIDTSYAAYSQLIFELWNGTTTRLDRETIPILKDGSNGTDGEPGSPGSPGADATIAWLDCPYSAIRCGSDGIAKVTQFVVKSYKRTGDNVQATDSSYGLSYAVTHTDSNGNTVSGNSGNSSIGSITVSIGTDYKLKDVVINLSYGSKIIQTLTLIPVLDGPMGEQGYNYVPEVLGVWDATQQYVWNTTVRQGCLYPIEGVYYLYVVKERFKYPPVGTLPTDESYWVQVGQYKTVFAEAVYTPNANIGGFYLTNKLFMSSEYACEYVYVKTTYIYYGLYAPSKLYAVNSIVYYGGSYYLCHTQNAAGTTSPSTSYWKLINSSNFTANKLEYLLNIVKGKATEQTIVDGVTITACCDSNTGYKTLRKNSNGGWMVFTNHGTTNSDALATNGGWRYLTDTEYSIIGITPATESLPTEFEKISIPRYTLDGTSGTPTTLMPDDSVWTYDQSGKQVMGRRDRKRIELSPKDGNIAIYNGSNKQCIDMVGDNITKDKLFGSGIGSINAASFSKVTTKYTEKEQKVSYSPSSGVQINGLANISVSGTISAFAGSPSGNISPRSYCRVDVGLARNGEVVKNLASLYSDGIQYSGMPFSANVTVNGNGEIYTIVVSVSYWQRYDNDSITGYYHASISSATYNYESFVTRVFANGIALGNNSTNHFAAFQDGNNIRVKGITNGGKYGYELDADKGLLVTRNKLQGIVPMLVYYAFVTDSGSALSVASKYNFDGGTPTWERNAAGKYTFTMPSSWSEGGMDFKSNLIPTIICNGTTFGVSAQIYALTKTSITICTDNDMTLDSSNLIIKLEYIG